MILYEWRDAVKRVGPPVLDADDGKATFRSVFGFPRETAAVIRRQENMKDLGGNVLFADTIFIDIDNSENISAVLAAIEDLEYTVWDTGNRGCHIHIPLETPLVGVHVPYSIIYWLKSRGVWDLIDKTVYRPASIFRAPGATHRKTGRQKTQTASHDGKKPLLFTRIPPPIQPVMYTVEEGSPEAQLDFYRNMLLERTPGDRHMHCYILFCSGKRAGLDRKSVEDCIRWWNSHFADPPHPDSVIERKLKGFK